MEKIKSENAALEYLGTAYLKTPRVLIDLVFSQRRSERVRGRLHLALFALSNYTGCSKEVGGERIVFERGELCCTLLELSRFTGIEFNLVRYHLDQLRKKGLVECEPLGDRSRIRVLGYDCFTAPSQGEKSGMASPPVIAQRMAEEEARMFGENKSRTDLVDYGS